jgi:hypothetical protein
MALSKLAPGITSITGKMGGVVFKSDASGQHVVSMARTVSKPSTPDQKHQRSWYAGIKLEEHAGGPPVEGYELPKGKNTAIIYSLETLYAFRKPSLLMPQEHTIDHNDPELAWIMDWIHLIWQPWCDDKGLSQDIMNMVLAFWYMKAKWEYGMAGSAAMTYAKEHLIVVLDIAFVSPVGLILTMWLGGIALQLYIELLDWLEGVNGHIDFTVGRVLIRKENALYYGNLIAHPSRKMYDFHACRMIESAGFTWDIEPDTATHQLHHLSMNELGQTVWPAYFTWYIYNWGDCNCRYRGLAYVVDTDLYRLECDEGQQEYWARQIGWSICDLPEPWKGQCSCTYLNQLHDYFNYEGHPRPPL